MSIRTDWELCRAAQLGDIFAAKIIAEKYKKYIEKYPQTCYCGKHVCSHMTGGDSDCGVPYYTGSHNTIPVFVECGYLREEDYPLQ